MSVKLTICLLALYSSNVIASSEVASAPAEVAIEASQVVANVGVRVGITVQINVAEGVPSLLYFLNVSQCATVLAGPKTKTLQGGDHVRLAVSLRVERPGPCPVTVIVKTPNRPSGGHLQTVRGVVLNPALVESSSVTRGMSASGQATVEAPACSPAVSSC